MLVGVDELVLFMRVGGVALKMVMDGDGRGKCWG